MELAANKFSQELSSPHQSLYELFPELEDIFPHELDDSLLTESLQSTWRNDWRSTKSDIDTVPLTLVPTFCIENDISVCNNYKKEITQRKHLFQLKEEEKIAGSVKEDLSEITQINTKKQISKFNNSVSLSFQVKEKGAQTKQIMKVKGNENQKKENIIVEIKQDDKEFPVLKADDENSLLEQFELFNKCVSKCKISIAKSIKTSRINQTENKNNMKNSSVLPTIYQHKKLQKKKDTILNKDVTSEDTRKVSFKTVSIPSSKKSIKTISCAVTSSQGNLKNSDITKTAKAETSKDMKMNLMVLYDSSVSASNVLSDHNYAGHAANNSNANESIKQLSLLKSKYQKVCTTMECLYNNGSKTDSNLKSTNISDTNKKVLTLFNHIQAPDNLFKNIQCYKTTKESDTVNISSVNNNDIDKIASALAKIINQAKANSYLHGNTQPMISVLKKLPDAIPAVLPHSDTKVATNANKLLQNVIKQSAEHIQEQTTKPRKKLNLSEYRNRRGDGRIDSLQRTILIDVYHAYTTTEPINNPIDPINPIWSERIILSVTRNKLELKKNEPNPTTCEKEVQTYETLFELSTKVANDAEDKIEERKEKSAHNNKNSCNREKSIEILEETIRRSRSLSQYRSKNENRNKRKRSKTRSRSSSSNSNKSTSSSSSSNSSSSSSSKSSRSRSSKSKSRSRSRSRSGTRSRSSFSSSNNRHRKRRRLNRRRSSIISSTSNSRSSHSLTSRSKHSRSRSKSSRSRSRSFPRYYSRSRSSSRSTFGRNKESNYRRRNSNNRERSYMEKDSRYRKDSHMYRRAGYYQLRDNRISWRSPYRRSYTWNSREKQKEVEERRVIYVGRLGEEVTKTSLRRRFEVFGTVMDVSIHFREHADNYGFVTFERKEDAYEAIEHGNDNPSLPRYDLSFGGRRAFCKTRYADLDNMETSSVYNFHYVDEEIGFDYLLEKAKADLRRNKQKQF